MQKDSNFSETWASIYIYLEAANVIIVSRICFCLYTWHISSMQFDFRILCITTKRTVNTSYLFHLLVLKTNLTSRKEKHIMVLLNSIIYIYWYIYITRWFHTQWLVFIYNIFISWYFIFFDQIDLNYILFSPDLKTSKHFYWSFWCDQKFNAPSSRLKRSWCYKIQQTWKTTQSLVIVKCIVFDGKNNKVHFPNDSLIGKGKCWYYLGNSNASW